MKRLLLACSVVFAFGAMCTGAPLTDAPTDAPTDGTPVDGEKDKEVVVVPVPEGDGGEHWCCEYAETAGGDKKFALVEGPAECNDKFGAKEGRWMEGVQCTPCCCKSPNDAADPSKGDAFERTTPGACAGVGECLAGDAKECVVAEPEDDKDVAPGPKPAPRPGGGTKKPGGPGTGSGAKRPPQPH